MLTRMSTPPWSALIFSDQRVALSRVGDVGGIGDELKSARGRFLPRPFEFLRISRDDDRDGARFGYPKCGGLADARRAAGDDHHFALHATAATNGR